MWTHLIVLVSLTHMASGANKGLASQIVREPRDQVQRGGVSSVLFEKVAEIHLSKSTWGITSYVNLKTFLMYWKYTKGELQKLELRIKRWSKGYGKSRSTNGRGPHQIEVDRQLYLVYDDLAFTKLRHKALRKRFQDLIDFIEV